MKFVARGRSWTRGGDAKILVAEDSPTQAFHIKHLLRRPGSRRNGRRRRSKRCRRSSAACPDLLLTDLDMPLMNGLELVESVRRRFPRVPVVLMTAYGSDEVAARALEAGAASYVPKRNLEKELLETIRDLLAVVEADRNWPAVGITSSRRNRVSVGQRIGGDPAIVATSKGT